MRTFLLISVLITGLAGANWLMPAAWAWELPGGKGGNVQTRYMKVFMSLEQNLLAAQLSNNKQQLSALLSPFFELNAKSQQSQPRVDFLAQKLDGDWHITDFRVYEVGANAVVYFTLTAAAHPSQTLVDVWQPHQQSWQLRVRFKS